MNLPATATVVGSGTMGPGIAATLARAGVSVRLYDISDDAIANAKASYQTVQGVLGQMKPDDSRLLGAPDRSALLCVLTSALTAQSIAPSRGGVVTVGGVSFTIGRRPDAQPSGITEILIAPTA